jgi:phosphopantothenoylcysteine synthetase/decarboxylase
MFEHPITATQLAALSSWGIHIISPISKVLACGDTGMFRKMRALQLMLYPVSYFYNLILKARIVSWLYPL